MDCTRDRRRMGETRPYHVGSEPSYLRRVGYDITAFKEGAYEVKYALERRATLENAPNVAGMGSTARIPVETLRSALLALRAHEPSSLITTGVGFIDVRGLPDDVVLHKHSDAEEWTFRKAQLDAFMSDCIAYCESAGQSSILIEVA